MISDREPRCRLLGQLQAKLMQGQFVVMARSGMARQDKTPAVRSRQMDVDHLDG